MAEPARKELSQRGIRVTLISPGNDDTPLLRQHPAVALTDDDAPGP
jgi:NAD(P)-dependent dehydrogenase (short-subunit alcohol dehydrogenase family)